MRRRLPEAEDEVAMPEHLRRFRATDWPDVDPVTASIRWTHARGKWRRDDGLRVWTRRRVADR